MEYPRRLPVPACAEASDVGVSIIGIYPFVGDGAELALMRLTVIPRWVTVSSCPGVGERQNVNILLPAVRVGDGALNARPMVAGIAPG